VTIADVINITFSHHVVMSGIIYLMGRKVINICVSYNTYVNFTTSFGLICRVQAKFP
jgi:hypothetical protein